MRELGWEEAMESMPSKEVADALKSLREGHQRFLDGKPNAHSYSQEALRTISTNQHPIAAIVACSDSRVAPEIVFDQPLGGIFASRVPGNVASDSAKWMLDIAVSELHVPVVIVLGHIGCLAVGQLLEGKIGVSGGTLRFDVQKAIHRARMKGTENLARQAVIENVGVTLENLRRDSFPVQKAVERGELGLLGGYYEMDTGRVHLLI